MQQSSQDLIKKRAWHLEITQKLSKIQLYTISDHILAETIRGGEMRWSRELIDTERNESSEWK